MRQRNLIAQKPDGGFVNVKADHNGKLSTDTQKSSSGETLTTSLTPVIQETFQYTVNSRVWDKDTLGSGTVTHDNAKAVLSTGTTEDSYAEIISKKRIKCRAGMGVVCRFTALWEEGKGADYVSFIGVIDGDSKNGLLFFKDAEGMSIEHYNDSKVVGSIAQADWDDPCDGTSIMPVIDWSKGNVFEIRYQHLGYGAIRFSIENPNTGLFQLIHTIKYANTNEEPSLSNSTLPFRVFISNTQTGAVNTKIKTASVVCFVEGENKINETIKNIYTRDIKATTTENAVFTIRNNTTFNSIENNSIVYPTYLSVSNTEKTAQVFEEYIKDMFKAKSNSEKGTPQYLLAKLFMNALYGKQIQRPIPSNSKYVSTNAEYWSFWSEHYITDMERFEDKDGNAIFHVSGLPRNEEQLEKSITKPTHYGAFILAYSRRIMYEYIKEANPTGEIHLDIYYTDTDSLQMHVECAMKILRLGDKSIGGITDDLGNGCKIIRGLWIAPKLYMLEFTTKDAFTEGLTKDDQAHISKGVHIKTNEYGVKQYFHFRGKGLNAQELNVEAYEKMDRGESITNTRDFQMKKINTSRNSKQQDIPHFSIVHNENIKKIVNENKWAGREFINLNDSVPHGFYARG